MSFEGKNLSRAYTFWIGSLMFGLPLLSSLYLVEYSTYSLVKYLLPYILVCIIVGFFLLSRSTGKRRTRKKKSELDHLEDSKIAGLEGNRKNSYFLAYLSLVFASICVASYWVMKYFVAINYPSPNGTYASISAIIYLVALCVAIGSGVPFAIVRIFPMVRSALSFERKYTMIGVIVGVSYFVTYLILVNQIIISGFNTPPGNYVPSPSGSYPFWFVFTAGPPPSAIVESAIYVPQILLQLNRYFNLIILPFEIILATVLSSLVAAMVVSTLFMIRRSSLNHSCMTGATVSGLGGFFGFTATCPTCLVPTLVSVFFGGVSSTAPSIYSHLAGVVLPPVLSILALSLGLFLLDFQSKKVRIAFKSLSSLLTRSNP